MKNFKLSHKTTSQFAFLVWVILAATIFNSCCLPKAPTPPDYRIKSTTDREYGILGGKALFEYDTDGKLKRWNTGPSSWYDLTHSTGQVSLSFWYKNINVNNEIIPLTADGYATKSSYSSSITFNTQGYIIKAENSVKRNDYSYDADNNLIKNQTTEISTSAILTTITYTYTNKKDLRVDGLEWLTGKHSTYLAASKTTIDNNNSSAVTENYTYVVDSYGRVTQKSITQEGKAPINYTYEYFD